MLIRFNRKNFHIFLAFMTLISTLAISLPASKAYAATISILEPQTGWNYNNYVNVRANVTGTDFTKVEVYYAVGANAYNVTPDATQNVISGRTDFFYSLNLGAQADTTAGKIKVVAKNASNVVISSQEVTGLKKTNLSTALSGLTDGATVLKSGGVTIGTRFDMWSSKATKAQVWIYASGDNAAGTPSKVVDLIKQTAVVTGGSNWAADVLNDGATVYGNGLYYALRVWGPNWTYDTNWRPGTVHGFVLDVDADGNRFNPNKLLLDPYARTFNKDFDLSNAIFQSGAVNRNNDSAGPAPKGIVYDPTTYAWGTDVPLNVAMKDSIFYETQVRGFTNDASSGVANPGTYKGLGQKVSHLNNLGVTNIELMPIHETNNDQNDVDPTNATGDNYWGYYTENFFSPDRRYSSDKSNLGPITEFKNMVKTLHSNGKEVTLDVVFNHTAEGMTIGDNSTSTILSFRGIDNQAYYSLTADKQGFIDNTCCGNFNTANPKGTQFVMDSLKYWVNEMHVDGFRFDLAPVLGNSQQNGGFTFDKNSSLLNRIYSELPNTKMIAEPWANGAGTYQMGNFPGSVDAGQNAWSEWNDKFRDTVRQAVKGDNGVISALATRVSGSSDLFGDDGRRPYNSVNFITAHDGFTLNDVVSYNSKNNLQAYPYGPSNGGSDNNYSWDSGGDDNLRRQQIRNMTTELLLSSGTPMILGGDEMRRSQQGNNNTYNLDTVANFYNWNNLTTNSKIFDYSKGLIALRKAHSALRRGAFYTGTDHNGDGIPDIQWSGVNFNSPDWSTGSHTLAWRIDGASAETKAAANDNDFYVMANHYWGDLNFQLPPNHVGKKWYRVADTALWAETGASISSNIDTPGSEDLITDGTWTNTFATGFAGNSSYNYGVKARSMVVFIEK